MYIHNYFDMYVCMFVAYLEDLVEQDAYFQVLANGFLRVVVRLCCTDAGAFLQSLLGMF